MGFDYGIIATICFSINPSSKRSLAFLITFTLWSRSKILLLCCNIFSSKFNLLFCSWMIEVSNESLKFPSLTFSFLIFRLLLMSSVKVMVLLFSFLEWRFKKILNYRCLLNWWSYHFFHFWSWGRKRCWTVDFHDILVWVFSFIIVTF